MSNPHLKACSQCTATNKGGGPRRRCSKRTCKYGPKCYVHSVFQDGLEIKPSRAIPAAGFGLFTTNKKKNADGFRPGQKICDYNGRAVTSVAAKERVEARADCMYGDYLIQTKNNYWIDASKTNSSLGRWVNDPRGTGHRANAMFITTGRRREGAALRAIKRIPPNTEILVNYGDWSAQRWADVISGRQGRRRDEAPEPPPAAAAAPVRRRRRQGLPERPAPPPPRYRPPPASVRREQRLVKRPHGG